MSLVTQLVGFGLRQVIGDYADNAVQVIAAIEQRFRDHSRTLPKALEQAHTRAWQALGVALAGDGLLDRIKVFVASGDDKGVREQVQLFLKGNAVSFHGTPAEFRQDCLDELKRLRRSGLLSTQGGSAAEIARQAAGFKRHADPQGLIEESRRAVAGVADALANEYPNLSRLLRAPTPARPPLLAAAFCYFFRREVETDEELAHGLFFDGLRQLSASQAKAFGEVGKALAALGGQFDALFEQLGRIEAAVEETHAVAVETHGAVLDIQAEQQRSANLHLANAGEIRILREQVQQLLSQVGMARGEVRPGNSCSIRGEDERRAVKALLARFRRLPAEEQRQLPALLNGLGKLQIGAGDFGEARQTFTEVAQVVSDPSGKAEACFNAYRTALEEKRWDAALAALREAASHDPQRFAPFPLHRYQPLRILGAGGFGTAVHCRDRHFDEDVVVKTLHVADLARGVDDIFREARILRRLSHPAIIGVRDCDYADPAHQARPYLVMDYFPGGTLQQFVEQRGPLNLEQLLAVAAQVAEGMKAAHAQEVLHRDLKPANVLVQQEGNAWKVKIIDFGLALRRQTVETSKVRTGATQKSMLDWSVAGTLHYAPPEQLGKLPGVQPGLYSDAYAFARTCCYAMFNATELRRKQWDSLPGPLADLLESCLEPDPRQRPNGFDPVLAVLAECSRTVAETRRHEQEERLRREQEEREQQEASPQSGFIPCRMPIYFLLDCSVSMVGEPMEAVRQGLRSLVSDLRTDPLALERVWVSVITFGSRVHQAVPLTDILEFRAPDLHADTQQGVDLGGALRCFLEAVRREVIPTTRVRKGDFKPLSVIMVSQSSTTPLDIGANRLQAAREWIPCPVIIAFPGADMEQLKRLSPIVVGATDVASDQLKWYIRDRLTKNYDFG